MVARGVRTIGADVGCRGIAQRAVEVDVDPGDERSARRSPTGFDHRRARLYQVVGRIDEDRVGLD
ncbi:MAG: hypothetical protein M9927_24590 [Anaerolineae bacterium]|nr:hypothetical protein [Anaerolineae bacterium]